ncbi:MULTISPECIES: long-chain fatty acid--CoA ligase [unclassified Sphingomonas]|uniref:long-chain fatty acid--CoA ligase n=1 Tax=unclassified Sphingomonas TaxID=196159 RepID=UPI0006F384EF|nr:MULTISPECIES: long-chain fatty acid--CoA ligase [unclassified Sphingomonas]KQX17495.1 long-chain fatty acid--CoA ligase [Sphingomonas sp. Root1294]KQY70421.1 long-chain fatty acid--CoA ligase [Sphingomonas sp. Root50]KRB92093.1 long-chain fatty acid--CoA ligase [Sphingomonas sp. Root720]
MNGSMLDWPLTLDRIMVHAERWHPDQMVVGAAADGTMVRRTYAECGDRARRLSAALIARGIGRGDRVGTLGWNTVPHFEAWYAIMGIGAVCHTLNLRMNAEQLAWVARDAGDRLLLVDAALLPLAQAVQALCPTIEGIVVLGEGGTDELVEAHRPATWGGFGEDQPAGLCYTSGTTGDPKGVLYTHRSNFLHTLTIIQPDIFGLAGVDSVLPIVPMFHANAWGIAFAAPAVGAKLVMPGPRLDGASIHRLIREEGVTTSAAVPTVWQGLLDHLDRDGGDLEPLRRVVIGGAACPPSMQRRLVDQYGVEVRHAWGMTELSPLGSVSTPNAAVAGLDPEERRRVLMSQGRPPLGVDLKIVTDDPAAGPEVPGRLLARGAATVGRYFGREGPATDAEGWFETGDVAVIDRHGFLHITDRDKDVVKSGGEWISSQGLEAIAAEHPAVAHCAVIAADCDRWGERPLLVVQLRAGMDCGDAALLEPFDGAVPRWWVPDAIVRVDAMPLGPTGKIDKRALRTAYRGRLRAS